MKNISLSCAMVCLAMLVPGDSGADQRAAHQGALQVDPFQAAQVAHTTATTNQPFKLGIENISDEFVAWLGKYKVGLITNHTGRDQQGRRTVDVLLERGIKITKLFAPEHGLNGAVLAAEKVHDEVDGATGLPVISLYGHGSGRKVAHKDLKDIDIILFDIQDSGMRHYTYISTMLNALETAAQEHKVFVVFDRPNPLACTMEGPLVEPELQSFISIAPIPVRHGMTIGELAGYFNQKILKKQAQLYVVRMNGYDRTRDMSHTLALNLSPNIACGAACRGYSFLGMLGEVSPCDVGVGGKNAFQIIGLPATQLADRAWYNLHVQLKKLGVESDLYTYQNTRKKAPYKGLFLTMHEIGQVQGFKAFLTVLDFLKSSGVDFKYSKDFNKAIGTYGVQKVLNGEMSRADFAQQVNKGLHTFYDKAKSFYLYATLPKVVELTL